jgi:ribosomal protein L37E
MDEVIIDPEGADPIGQDEQHRHIEVTTHVLRQRGGVPYEVERKVCSSCGKVLDERPLRRPAT